MIKLLLVVFNLCIFSLYSQSIDPDIERIRARMDSIETFKAQMELKVDISFINIPNKFAKIEYTKGQETQVFSDDFVLIPKKGLDVSLYQLFKYDFITVDRGTEIKNKKSLKVVNIIPTDKKADFSIATLYLDLSHDRISESEIHTKKDGVYAIKMNYGSNRNTLPETIEVNFEIERIRLPLRYMGKEADIDKSKYKSDDLKTGKIFLSFEYNDVTYKS